MNLESILIICLSLVINSQQTLLEQAHKYNLNIEFNQVQGNSSGNMTQDQITLVVNSILSAQRNYSPPQYDQMAQYIGDSLSQLIQPKWTAFVFTNRSTNVAIAAQAHLNRWAVVVGVGKLNMSYAVVQRYSGQCLKPTSKLSNNETRFQNYFGNSVTDIMKQKITVCIQSSIAYSGDDMAKAAAYIQDKMRNDGQWNVVISKPSTVSGSYACTINDSWAILVGFGDFKWNYYMYLGNF